VTSRMTDRMTLTLFPNFPFRWDGLVVFFRRVTMNPFFFVLLLAVSLTVALAQTPKFSSSFSAHVTQQGVFNGVEFKDKGEWFFDAVGRQQRMNVGHKARPHAFWWGFWNISKQYIYYHANRSCVASSFTEDFYTLFSWLPNAKPAGSCPGEGGAKIGKLFEWTNGGVSYSMCSTSDFVSPLWYSISLPTEEFLTTFHRFNGEAPPSNVFKLPAQCSGL